MGKTERFLVISSRAVLSAISIAILLGAPTPVQQLSNEWKHLVMGVAQSGVVFIEVPMNPAFYGPARRGTDWKYLESDSGEAGDYERALPSSKFFGQLYTYDGETTYVKPKIAYWGSKVDPRLINQDLLLKATDYRVGDVLNAVSYGTAGQIRIVDFEVRFNLPDTRCIVLAVAVPVDMTLPNGALVVATKKPFECKQCAVQVSRAPEGLSRRIAEAALHSAWMTGGPIGEVVVLGGHFMSRRQEYVTYLHETGSSAWKTLVLDESVSPVAILGETSYLQIIPKGVSDLDNDGLNEIWVHLQGSEGFSDGILFFQAGRKKFRLLKTELNGM